jgi:4-alpha-glucanotransferase
MSDALDRLLQRYGVGAEYRDYRGQVQQIGRAAQLAILAAMGVDASTGSAVDAELHKQETKRWTRFLPPVWVAGQGRPIELPVALPREPNAAQLRWTVTLEDGERRSGSAQLDTLAVAEQAQIDGRSFKRLTVVLPDSLPLGYHSLTVTLDDGSCEELQLIVAPHKCFEPARLSSGGRVWGLSVQLYSLRSATNWGMGDFRDLRELIALAAPLGCATIGLNPLHALMPANPAHISPYSPSNRQFLNVLYIAVPDVPEFVECDAAHRRVAEPAFQALLAELRAANNVDYVRVAAAKFEILQLMYAHFRAAHLAQDTARAAAFRKFLDSRGRRLRLHAIFDALDAHLRLQGPQYWGWPSWPEEYRDPASSAVHRFARDRAQDVEYFLYLQWLTEEQLRAAQSAARASGMVIGLYGDVAVGANPSGSETWSNPRLYLQGASIGAPPDPLALKGQDWGIPPQDPGELKAEGYESFVALIRNNMRSFAALRLDHVMTLYRLWWVPRGSSSREGAYVHYPLEDLIAVLALESRINHCVVIGEDLGTVPDAVTAAMERYQAYHYKVLLFEQELDGTFKAPSRYVRHALATVTTHDLPTLRGWWEEHDLSLRDDLQLYPSEVIRIEMHEKRARDRVQLMRALTGAGLWHWQPHEPPPVYSPALARAVHLFLGSSTANIALLQLEDLIGMTDPVNVPGTDTEHPNWQRKITVETSAIFARADVQESLTAMNRARRGENPNI